MLLLPLRVQISRVSWLDVSRQRRLPVQWSISRSTTTHRDSSSNALPFATRSAVYKLFCLRWFVSCEVFREIDSCGYFTKRYDASQFDEQRILLRNEVFELFHLRWFVSSEVLREIDPRTRTCTHMSYPQNTFLHNPSILPWATTNAICAPYGTNIFMSSHSK